MELINEFGLGRKYGQTMTFNDVKHNLEDFKKMIIDNQEFYDEIRASILNKINNAEIKTEENVED